MSLLPLMKLRLATPTVLVDVGRRARPLVRPRRRRPPRDRRAHPSPRPRDERPARRGVRGAARGRGPGRRQPGAAPRHDRRVGRARRSRERSARGAARARRHVRRAGPGRDAHGRGARLLPGFLETALAPDELLTEIRVPQDRRQRVRVREVQPAGPGLGDRRRGRGARRTAARASALVNMGSTPLRADGGRDGARAGRVAGRRGARRPPTAPSRRPTSTRRPSTASTSRRCSSGARSRRSEHAAPSPRSCLAAGRGVRFGGDAPKPLALAARPAAASRTRSTPRRRAGCAPVVLVVVRRPGRGARRGRRGRDRAQRRARARHRVEPAVRARGTSSPMAQVAGGRRRSRRPAARRRGRRTAGSRRAYADGARARGRDLRRRARQPGADRARSTGPRRWSSTATRARGCSSAAIRAVEVPCDGTGAPTDVDTPEDLAELEARWRSPTASE